MSAFGVLSWWFDSLMASASCLTVARTSKAH